MNDRVDELLRDYASRWRADQAPPRSAYAMAHRAATGAVRHPRWVPAIAVAVAVVVVLVGLEVARGRWALQPAPATSPTPTVSTGVVPFLALPATRKTLPTTLMNPVPDPSSAAPLPPCAAADVNATSELGAAGGHTYLRVMFTSRGRACKLEGTPTVTPLDAKGSPANVPVTHDDSIFGPYLYPVAVSGTAAASLQTEWTSWHWCGATITIAKLRIAMPGGGSVTVDGYGDSSCADRPGLPGRPALVVAGFSPTTYQAEQATTAFHGVTAAIEAPKSVPAGSPVRLVISLTVPEGAGVLLNICPDYMVYVGDRSQTYALNCAAVPNLDSKGRPFLPGGSTTRFAAEIDAPTVAADYKVGWVLRPGGDDTIATATMITVE
jgi:hypothetical protein